MRARMDAHEKKREARMMLGDAGGGCAGESKESATDAPFHYAALGIAKSATAKEIKKAYDIVGARNLPDDELVEFLQHKVIESLTTGIEADFESEEKRPGNESFRRKELQKILDSDNHGVREAHLGDIVKVKDEGFFVEGVIVAMTATDNTVFAMVDFGLDYISTEFREFIKHQRNYKNKHRKHRKP